MRRRAFLTYSLLASQLHSQPRTPEANAAIFNRVWNAVQQNFHDPNLRGVNWTGVRTLYLSRVRTCRTAEELLTLLREMLSTLNNSHVFLYSREEWALRRNILPFHFVHASGRAYVRYVLRSRGVGVLLADVQPGDEILRVDGTPARRLRPLTLARLEPVHGNPNFGLPGSVAGMEVRRGGRVVWIDVARAKRPGGFAPVTVALVPGTDALHIRFQSLEQSQLPAAELKALWTDVSQSKRLILDFRNCVGGDPAVYAFLASSLLGPDRALFQWIPRSGSGEGLIPASTDDSAPRFSGRLAFLVNSNTESGPEILVATCAEYKRGVVIGEPTAGAFHGPTRAFELPENFAVCAPVRKIRFASRNRLRTQRRATGRSDTEHN